MSSPVLGRAGYVPPASTTPTAAPGSVGRRARRSAGSAPRAAASRTGPSAPPSSGSMTWVSGSPRRALHSSRTGPRSVRIRPAYRKPRNGRAAAGQLGEDRPVDVGQDRVDVRLGHVGEWRVGAHPARVRPGIAVAEPLVVARRRQGDRPHAVAHGDDGRFGPVQPFLDDDPRPVAPAVQLVERAGRVRARARGP